jgi:hypothetical protein
MLRDRVSRREIVVAVTIKNVRLEILFTSVDSELKRLVAGERV